MRTGERVHGALCAVALPGATQSSIALLQEVADALASGLETHHQLRMGTEAIALRAKAEARLESLIEHAPVAILTTRGGTILSGNGAYRSLLGIASAAGPEGRATWADLHPASQATVQARTKAWEAGTAAPGTCELRCVHRDGTEVLVVAQPLVLTLDDGPTTLLFLTDPTRLNY